MTEAAKTGAAASEAGAAKVEGTATTGATALGTDGAKKTDDKGAAAGEQKTPEQIAAEAAAGKTDEKPKGEETKEGKAAAEAAKAPAEYKLTIPDGVEMSDDVVKLYVDEAKELGLTPEQAQKRLERDIAAVATRTKALEDDLKADPVLGGKNLEATLELARKGKEAFLPKDSEEAVLINGWLNSTGLGNHKALVRAFARLGQLVGEEKLVQGAGGGEGQKTAAEVLYGKP